MTTSARLTVTVAFLVLSISGCASQGSSQNQQTDQKQTKDTRPIEERLRVGMTKEEVRQAIGEPAGKSVNSKGEESWRYSDMGKAFIPFYVIGGGKFQHLTVNFDSESKVKEWSSTTQGLY
jgi:outer membrane protein assembly factor BamE (lipoprotein component of BamABCDE complex)